MLTQRKQYTVGCILLVLLGACEDAAGPASSKQPLLRQPAFATQYAGAEITPDANTMVLDHFNNSTVGTPAGPLVFAASDIGLGMAGTFGAGNYVKYVLAGPPQAQGTIEMWIRPNTLLPPGTQLNNGLLDLNWYDVTYYPCAGHLLYMSILPSHDNKPWGYLAGTVSIVGSNPVPAGEWTHFAFSWGAAGTRLYINGIPEVAAVGAPAWWSSTVYAYLNYWGAPTGCGGDFAAFDGLIDEFHYSRVQRTDAEILAHALLVATLIEIDIDIKPGSEPNCFNNDGHGVIPVAILGSSTFDVTRVDPATVKLEGLSVAARGKSNTLLASYEDSNGDGFTDLVVKIEDVDGVFTSGAGSATLIGNLKPEFGGTPITGSDDICIVPNL